MGSTGETVPLERLGAELGEDLTGWTGHRSRTGWLLVSPGEAFSATRYFVEDAGTCFVVPNDVPGAEAMEQRLQDEAFRRAMTLSK